MHIDKDGNPVRVFEGHNLTVNSLSQGKAGELVSGSWDGSAIVWNTETGEQIAKLEGHQHAVTVLALGNGLIITGA